MLDQLTELDDDTLAQYLATLSPVERQALNQAVENQWRRDPSTMAAHLDRRYKRWRYIALLGDAFRRAATGETKRVIIMMPARMGKTLVTSVWGTVWALDRDPTAHVILTSYGHDLAVKNSGMVKDLAVEHAAHLNFKVRDDRRAKDRWETTAGGQVMAAGVGGAMTGFGGDLILCFRGDTLVSTPDGPVPISQITPNGCTIWAYDHSKGRIVEAPVAATRISHATELVEVVFTSGRRFVCTPDHPVFTVDRGYVAAKDLTSGTTTCTTGEPHVRPLWHHVSTGKRRRSEVTASRHHRLLLWPLVSRRIATGHPAVQAMRRPRRERAPHVRSLLSRALPLPTIAEPPRQVVPSLRRRVQTHQPLHDLLLTHLRGPHALPKDARRRQLEVPGWLTPVHRAVQEDETADPGTGRQLLRRLLQAGDVRQPGVSDRGAPHQPRQARQPTGEPGHALHALPHDPPQVGRDTVSVVRAVRTTGEPVYDLTVDGPSNFFADGILVHNCDDPLKNWQEAASQLHRDTVWDWFRSVVYTRLQTPDSAIVIIGTRWHEDDLVGRCLNPPDGGTPDDWEVIRLPAIAEDPDTGVNPWERSPDPLGRRPGEPIEPERFPLETVQDRARVLGSFLAAAMEQQRPAPAEGSLIRRDWWRQYTVAPKFPDEWVITWDSAFKGADTSDFCVGQVWCREGTDFYLIDQVRARMDYPTFKRTVVSLARRWPQARRILIEDTANGPAVIAELEHTITGIVPYTPRGSKENRVHAVSGLIEAGNVYLPDPGYQDVDGVDRSFVHDYVTELASFPTGVTDDQVDATTMALDHLSHRDNGPAVGTYRRTPPRR